MHAKQLRAAKAKIRAVAEGWRALQRAGTVDPQIRISLP